MTKHELAIKWKKYVSVFFESGDVLDCEEAKAPKAGDTIDNDKVLYVHPLLINFKLLKNVEKKTS